MKSARAGRHRPSHSPPGRGHDPRARARNGRIEDAVAGDGDTAAACSRAASPRFTAYRRRRGRRWLAAPAGRAGPGGTRARHVRGPRARRAGGTGPPAR
ncbi:hypothetical protein HBB16_05475 [Pseudonocardia sp. MCCB 268]|nr:hypothetical protein [Pseudonocardia cytotoxica]